MAGESRALREDVEVSDAAELIASFRADQAGGALGDSDSAFRLAKEGRRENEEEGFGEIAFAYFPSFDGPGPGEAPRLKFRALEKLHFLVGVFP